MSHQSFHSSKNKPELFPAMFPDSDIAKQYSMKATKYKYLITHGIAPYVEGKLINDIKKAEGYVASFHMKLSTVQCSQTKWT